MHERLNAAQDIYGNGNPSYAINLFICSDFRLKRIQNILYFTTIALVIKLVFFKSFKIRGIFLAIFRLFFAALSSLVAKLGLRGK